MGLHWKEEFKIRVTLDIDRHYPNENVVMMKYLKLWALTGVKPEVRVSSRGRGLHLICRGVQCSYDYSLTVRRMLGECEKRLQFDEELDHKPKQIVWSEKRYKGKTFKVEPIDEKHVLSMPFWVAR